MTEYNVPFYFALPRGANGPADLAAAKAHIAKTFDVTGPAEVVRHELAFTLCRINAAEVSA